MKLPLLIHPPAPPAPTTSVCVDATGTTASSVSPLSLLSDLCEGNNKEVEGEEIVKKKGGRLKGTTNKAKRENSQNIQVAMQEATSLCIEEKDRVALTQAKRVADGKYASIIDSVRIKYDLDESSFSTETILSRIKNQNSTGIGKQIMSPIAEIEPKIVEWCRPLSGMGEALTKYELMALADDIIRDTVYKKIF